MLNMISFIGVDKRTDLDKLIKIDIENDLAIADDQMIYHHVDLEFGVLYSESKAGHSPRYPSYEECLKIVDTLYSYGVAFSVHLCGKEVIDGFLEQKHAIKLLCSEASKIQLNYNINYFSDENDQQTLIKELINLSDRYNIVLQENKTKRNINQLIRSRLEEFPDYKNNIIFLHDASGGLGRKIDPIDVPYYNFYTGYAGGLTSDNVVDVIEKIDAINIFNNPYYVDMESGIRTNDLMDLDKIKLVVENIQHYYNNIEFK